MSTLVGFYLGLHDSSVAVAINGNVKYAKSERCTGKKHHHADLSFVREMIKEWSLDEIDAVCFSDGNRNRLGVCPEGVLAQEVPAIPGLQAVPTFCIDHHYAHMLSAWPIVDMGGTDLGIAIDGRGDHDIRRSIIRHPGSTSPTLEYSDTHPTMGLLFEGVGRFMGLSPHDTWMAESVDIAGKIMGAHAYGQVDAAYVDAIDPAYIRENIADLVKVIPWRGNVPFNDKTFFSFDNPSFRDWLATVHAVVEKETSDFFLRSAKPNEVIVYAGGCAQNVVCNEMLFRRFPHLAIPPHCYDGGISLGAIEFLRIQRGEPVFGKSGFPYWQNDIEDHTPSDATIDWVVELLANGKIVGWFQGRGEVGPRALGNRSILMNPAVKNGKQILNDRVKHRESWRPYGASILKNSTPEWVGEPLDSPFMLRATRLPHSVQTTIPAVVHIDSTCRFQTVDARDNSLFAELLERFHKMTGIPLLLNTSLNGGGQPIFACLDQCRSFIENVDIDAIVAGDTFFRRKAL